MKVKKNPNFLTHKPFQAFSEKRPFKSTVFENGYRDTNKEKVFDFVQCFLGDKLAAQVLYWLGIRATDSNYRIHYPEIKFS